MSPQCIDRKIEYSVKQRVIMSDSICDDNNNSEPDPAHLTSRVVFRGKEKKRRRRIENRYVSRSQSFSAARMRLLHVHASCATGGTASFA